MLEIGSVINGTYKILNEIGHGGMSVVYLALNERANKTWAVKEIRKDSSTDKEIVSQGLIAETEMLKRLHHDHLPSIIDVVDDEDTFIIVMDYIEGRTLQSLLDHSGKQDPELVLEWAKQLCDVLIYLHSQNPPIIYRDMKPANIMLKPNGDIILIDFGAAREYKEHSTGDTVLLGTKGYAAPEQFGGKGQTDARTDIYNLGATLYHLLTGYSPVDTDGNVYLLGEIDPIFQGSGWEQIIQKCCALKAKDRYQDCASLMVALENIKELGAEDRKRREKQWRRFLASVLVAIIGAIGFVSFTVAGNQLQSGIYNNYLDRARNAPDFQTAVSYYKSAINLNPSSIRAYQDLLSTIEKDGILSNEEHNVLYDILYAHGGTDRTNLNRLLSSNPKEHDVFLNRLAMDYYFAYEGSDKRTQGANKFKEVMDSSYLSEQQRNSARSLYQIGINYETLGMASNPYAIQTDESFSYGDFWDQMVDLTDGDIIVKTGGEDYAVLLIYEFAEQIRGKCVDFKNNGISKEIMEQQIDKLEKDLDELSSDNVSVIQKIEEARQCVGLARRQMETTYARPGVS